MTANKSETSPSSLATLLITQRKRLGFSQEELAEAANLSLRTVQRLEKGESLPRDFTLQSLAHALHLPVAALTTVSEAAPALPLEAREPQPAPPEEIPTYVALMYLSAFSYVLLPGANIVLPLLLRYRKRHVPQIQAAGSQLLNFELGWTLVTYNQQSPSDELIATYVLAAFNKKEQGRLRSGLAAHMTLLFLGTRSLVLPFRRQVEFCNSHAPYK